LRGKCSQGSVKEAAGELLGTQPSFVVYNGITSRQRGANNCPYFCNLDSAKGVSIVFPWSSSDPSSTLYPDGFTFGGPWLDFLRAYYPGSNYRVGLPEGSSESYLELMAPMIDGRTGRPIGRMADYSKPCPDYTYALKNTASFDCESVSYNPVNFFKWQEQYSEIKKGKTIPENELYADYNGDGKVDTKDFGVWLGHFVTLRK